jgi:hypothetical protein
MQLLRSDLLALARKYRALSELRRAQHRMSFSDARAPLRELSREFPGSLRELDSLPLEEIEKKGELLESAAREPEARPGIAPWMQWMHAYHLTMRAALAVKRRLAGRRAPSDALAFEIAGAVSAELGYRCDLEFVFAVARPPQGRINPIVLRRLALMFDADPEALGRALFPARARGARLPP